MIFSEVQPAAFIVADLAKKRVEITRRNWQSAALRRIVQRRCRRSLSPRIDGQHAVVPRSGGAARGAGSGVNPSQFQVITHSVKKTDPNDARNLALYLAKGLVPEVRMKEKTQAQVAA